MAFLRFLGKLLISVGLGVLMFVGWTLWGTGLYTEREQARLEKEFNRAPSSRASGSGLPPAGYAPVPGEPVFRMEIPSIDLSRIVVEGVGTEELRRAPGHYPSCRKGFGRPLCTPFPAIFPGEPGRVVVSGHRTTYGAPFWAINELAAGDPINVATKWGDFTYKVTKKDVVNPNSPFVIRQSDKEEIVLTTCNPRFSAAERLIVYASMSRSA
jgi:sortase A